MKRYECAMCRTKQKIKDEQVHIERRKHYAKCVRCGSMQRMLTSHEISLLKEDCKGR